MGKKAPSMSSIGPRRLLARLALPKEKNGVNCISKKFKSVDCSSRRMRTISSMVFLPEGIIFDILVLLPADILHNVMRYVCKEWHNVINSPEFINAHLQKSTNGLLIQIWGHPEVIHFADIINNCDVRKTKLRYRFCNRICASCDGLVLFRQDNNDSIFCVANLITNQILTLPPLSEPITADSLSSLVYVHSIRRYKVVYFDYNDNGYLVCATFLMGTDQTVWRPIDTEHIPNTNKDVINPEPLSAGGYLYWINDRSTYSSFVLALDVEAETLHHIPLPKVLKKKKCGDFMIRESFLIFMARKKEFVWEVWVLTELNTGEWTRLYNVDIRGQSGMLKQMLKSQNVSSGFCSLFPCVWLRNGELVIFRVSNLSPSETWIVFNIKTREVSSFTLEKNGDCNNYYRAHARAHVNSLVSLMVP